MNLGVGASGKSGQGKYIWEDVTVKNRVFRSPHIGYFIFVELQASFPSLPPSPFFLLHLSYHFHPTETVGNAGIL